MVLEGVEGVGKTTQVRRLTDYLRNKGYKVLETKEPGTPHLPITMALRGLMLDSQYEEQLTKTARELISQTIRSIHMEKLIIPGRDNYDFIIQDRGVLSGLSYGTACGNDSEWLEDMALTTTGCSYLYQIYDDVVLLKGDISIGLNRAKAAKQEFAAGDAMEAKGTSFMERVEENMNEFSRYFNTREIYVDGKTIEQVHQDIIKILNI